MYTNRSPEEKSYAFDNPSNVIYRQKKKREYAANKGRDITRAICKMLTRCNFEMEQKAQERGMGRWVGEKGRSEKELNKSMCDMKTG